MSFIIKGIFIDTPVVGQLRIRKGELLIENGIISSFSEKPIVNHNQLKVYDYQEKIIVPGLIDLHLHAPQYNFVGTAMDLELLDWLNSYVFPEESKFKDMEFAIKSYEIFVEDLVKSPTTRCVIFASLHTNSTLKLMELLENSGIIAYVGKVCMNRNSPDFYTEKSTENGIKETKRWLKEYNNKSYKNVYPIITPRFTPSCTDDYLKQLGELARENKLHIQSHLSENVGEIEWVKDLCPNTNFYGESYSKNNLFNNLTVMAHCVHSSEEEKKLMKDNGVFIAHCPTSNENLSSGICPAGKYLREGYNIGLGTDISGGDSLNLFDVIKASIKCSKLYWKYIDKKNNALNIKEALYLATLGGGKYFGKVGMFECGYEFDALVLRENHLKSGREFNFEERLERYTYLGQGKLDAKFVKGNKII